MVRSMTGFGRAERRHAGHVIQIDIKSVNHRFQETVVRMPREWLPLEDGLKKIVSSRVKRGRVDLFVTVEREENTAREVSVDWALAEGIVQAARMMDERFQLGGQPSVNDLLQFPEIVRPDGQAMPPVEDFAESVFACAGEALESLMAMREREGSYLRDDLSAKLDVIAAHRSDVVRLHPALIEQYRIQLRDKIAVLLEDRSIDEDRIAMEVALIAERSDIDEELTRLSSHIEQFREHLDKDEPIGKKLDFLVQEMNREVNTIGSKAIGVEISRYVVDMKAELEKIREQVQNIE